MREGHRRKNRGGVGRVVESKVRVEGGGVCKLTYREIIVTRNKKKDIIARQKNQEKRDQSVRR